MIPKLCYDIDKIEEQFDRIAQQYDSHRRCFIPCFDDYYVRSLSILKQYKSRVRHVVDLGAGTGLLSREIYKLYPEAQYTLVDVAEKMLKIAKERFAGLHNFEFVVGDYLNSIPRNCDMMGSALSIHHLEDKDKSLLYRHVYQSLTKEGCFINLDQFIASSEEINNLYNCWWLDYIDHSGITAEQKSAWLERRKLDKENTIEDTIAILRESGFREVQCIYHFMKFGVVLAIK